MIPMLGTNSELKKDRIYNFTLPAFYTRLDGEIVKTCPNAGACAKVCYARNGTYLFPSVKNFHETNLRLTLHYRNSWQRLMIEELRQPKFRPSGDPRRPLPGVNYLRLDPFLRFFHSSGAVAVRIHDSGDFYDRDYLDRWLEIAWTVDDVLFYAYTKEVTMFKELAPHEIPDNFRYLFSTGGLQDHLINPDTDRHADVFPDLPTMTRAGYASQEDSDLQAVMLPTTRIGIVANNIPAFNKRLNGRRFSEL